MNLILSGTAGAAAQAGAASGVQSLTWLLVGLPLLGAFVLMVGGRRTDRWGHWLAVLLSWAAFVIGAAVFLSVLGEPASERVSVQHLFSWVPAGAFSAEAALRVDTLSLTFVLLVTFVGSLIHVYSVAYMAADPDRRRFFAYLNLFVAAMLLLVLADNYLLLYVGWEGVGLASYLLIGFWNHNPSYAAAAKKAFVANRVGDIGLALAIASMFLVFGGVDFDTVLGGAQQDGLQYQGWMTFIGLMLLLGACGKSAQVPLQSWLGDAMAGPTPVSALIHAATMVTAGVYLVVRSGAVYQAAPTAALIVVIVGALSLLFGAIVASAKDDMKKVLAGSTMSQVGYMMLAAGLGPVGYAFAIFHLVTHGFFKAGMFLGAGSVMHGMDDVVDLRRFGDLARTMRITWLTFGAGWLSIIGFPFLSGFWSKDAIIEAAFVGEGWRPWVFGSVAMLAAGLTAFYASRMFFMMFHGRKRWDTGAHPHEAPPLMTVPMIVLALGSVFLGGVLTIGGAFVNWLTPVVGEAAEEEPVLSVPVITAITLALVAIGALWAWRQYAASDVPVVQPRGSLATVAARRDLFQDDVNEAVFMRPGQYLTRSLVFADTKGVDGAVGGIAGMVAGTAGWLRKFQTGFVRSYAASMLVGVVVLLGALVVVR